MEGMNILRLVARPLLAAPFIVDGVSALRSPRVHVDRARAVLPLVEKIAPEAEIDEEDLTLATRALGGVAVASGVCFALGRAPRAAASVLAGIAVPMALVNAPVWTARSTSERREMVSDLVRRLALVGGLGIAAADRVGEPSAAWKVANWRAQRGRIAEVRAEERRRLLAAGSAE